MSQNEFRVEESSTGYRVELWRHGKPYLTFMDGLTQEGAERGARVLTALWSKTIAQSREAFRVRKSSTVHRAELCRDGEADAMFPDRITQQRAEREARVLAALWIELRCFGQADSRSKRDGFKNAKSKA